MRSVSTLALLGIFAVSGCAQEPAAPVVAQRGDQAQQPGQPGQEPRAPLSKVGVKRVIDRPAVQNDLRQLALFYKTYETELGRVRSVDAFKSYIKRDGRLLVKAIDEGVYVVVPNVRADSEHVIAYERAPDAADQHVVAMGDGSIRTMNTQQLQAALKGQ